jgi:hypothetical protein
MIRENRRDDATARAVGMTRERASAVEMLVLRDRLGLRRFAKTARRDPEKRELLLALALDRIEKAERDDFIPLGFRKRRVRFPAA